MINLAEKHGLIFADIKIKFRGKEALISDVLIDTGSGGTIIMDPKVKTKYSLA